MTIAAHRVSAAIHGNPIPQGLYADHICRNRLCVNPAHIRAVDGKTNTLENSLAVTAINAKKTHCVRGHPFSGTNLVIDHRGRRSCLACQKIHDANSYRKKKSKAALEAE